MDYQSIREGSTEDKNDCTVVAVAIATDISYSEAQSLLAAAGRKRPSRFANEKYSEVIRIIDRNRTVIRIKIKTEPDRLARDLRDIEARARKDGELITYRFTDK